MIDTVKKLTSAGMAAMLILTETIAGANSPTAGSQNSTVVESQKLTDKEEKFTWQAVKKKSGGGYWTKTPKPIKVFGGIALFSIPVIIGGRIFYVEHLKPSVDAIIGIMKLNVKREEFKNKACRDDLDKMITALLVFMIQCLMIGHSFETCLTQVELLQLSSKQAIEDKITSLDRTQLFQLSQLLQLETDLNLDTINEMKQTSTGKLPFLELDGDEFDLILKKIPKLNDRTLNE
ncbi:MAG: hypothetical protein RsTaC01_0200 [Candidatus Paraimprobicoccus trichonymphae]|uniref:Uncharacterized protein n=1 Tax=Candidatus Paraimprobicoccus trichonymphae TaxID=3033793 RepID=A0AA48I5H9_9FIRM|nr:MAG: hypothetical protein RsTaC01_0200 [Candidatus Paraimprobicoccus trichonymphae]